MSFYTSLSGLKSAQTDLSVISNNIANSETNGFKKSNSAFSDIIAASASSNPSTTTGVGSSVANITQDFSLGPVEQTGNALDALVNGEGFFTVVSPLSGETQYTRNGHFHPDADRFLVNDQGAQVQVYPVDATGAVSSTTLQSIQLPTSNAAGADYSGVSIGQRGEIVATFTDGTSETLGVIGLANFVAPTGLKQLGNATWSATGNSGTATYGQPGSNGYGNLLPGALERSNVDIAEELVSLITAQRNYQANAKAIDTATQVSQAIMNLRT
ncbi:flagellar hook-basal body complex protein [Novosphingobium beihaiensis]|uniref:Flagellar hook protein FlgE n=1 Tax=Novosphingobium beihaiensis TaxID=2930389 RepID=A0ABT0BP57_9SPHN|nr:flagellar hook basal-body protein [Novosphingobium beihaiensis]MCJ2186836.1 flagellar hook basal-body protein [Novosphingobium beihaiensis]